MRYLSVCFLVLCLIASCAETRDIPPYAMYRGDFDPKNIACAEEVIREIAQKKDFRIEEKDREEMKVANSGVDSFFIFLMIKKQNPSDIGSWVLTIGNLFKGKTLSLTIGDIKFLTNKEKDHLAQEVVQVLEVDCNTHLERYNEPYVNEESK